VVDLAQLVAAGDAEGRDGAGELIIEGLRDRAILSVGLRRTEIAALTVGDFRQNRGYDSLRVIRKGGRRDALAIDPQTAARLRAYLEHAGHADDNDGPLFRPLRHKFQDLPSEIAGESGRKTSFAKSALTSKTLKLASLWRVSTVRLEPSEPDWQNEHLHDWQSPWSVLGGLKENPGVWGHGGGVV
jgi:integrase